LNLEESITEAKEIIKMVNPDCKLRTFGISKDSDNGSEEIERYEFLTDKGFYTFEYTEENEYWIVFNNEEEYTSENTDAMFAAMSIDKDMKFDKNDAVFIDSEDKSWIYYTEDEAIESYSSLIENEYNDMRTNMTEAYINSIAEVSIFETTTGSIEIRDGYYIDTDYLGQIKENIEIVMVKFEDYLDKRLKMYLEDMISFEFGKNKSNKYYRSRF
jgi:hypothetical protein